MTMGEKIFMLRKSRGWNQEELADRVNVTRQAVSRWELDSAKPDADKIIALCDLFSVPADYLLRDDYVEPEPVSAPAPEAPKPSALAEAVRKLTLKQWGAVAAVVVGGLVLLVLEIMERIIGGGEYCTATGHHYFGLMAFVMREDLMLVWILAAAAIFCGAIYLVVPLVGKLLDNAD